MPDPPRVTDEANLLRALQALEQRLTATLSAGLVALQTSLTTLQDNHNKGLLEQEKRNATFADRDRVEAIARHLHDRTNNQMLLEHRVDRIEKAIIDLSQSLQTLADKLTSEHTSDLKSHLDHLLTAGAISGATLLGFILDHLVK